MTSQPVTPAIIGSVVPEFVDAKGLRSIFGVSRSMGYELANAGLVKTVCLRRVGAIKGRRLWVAQSVRDWLLANLDQRKSSEDREQDIAKPEEANEQSSSGPQVQSSKAKDEAWRGLHSAEIEALRAERAQLAEQLATMKERARIKSLRAAA